MDMISFRFFLKNYLKINKLIFGFKNMNFSIYLYLENLLISSIFDIEIFLFFISNFMSRLH